MSFRPSERRRLVTSLVILLLLAAAANVPFALSRLVGRRARVGPGASPMMAVGPEAAAHGWVMMTPHETPWPPPDTWSQLRIFGACFYDIRAGNPGQDDEYFQVDLRRYGWPLPVLEDAQMWWNWNDPARQGPEPDPPMHVLWSGLILNPLIVGAPVWLVLVVFPTLLRVEIRRRHIRRGECTWCGYRMHDLSVCPECGRSSAPQATEPP